MKHQGSCLCGQVRFVIDGGFDHFFLCHCERCRKDTGSAHAANLFASDAQLSWLAGEERVRVYQLTGTQHIKSFCSECGSALPTQQNNGRLLVVPAGCLDTPPAIRPQAHIFVGSKADWDQIAGDIVQFAALP